MNEVSDELRQQYEEIAQAIEANGLGYALAHGYIQPDTSDDSLNKAIMKAVEGIGEIEDIIAPYRI